MVIQTINTIELGDIAVDAPPQLELHHDKMVLQVPPNAELATKCAIVDEFYRHQIEAAIPPLIAKWERLMGVHVASFTVRKMKTKWGSCTPDLQTIRFNLELAEKPAECLEYVIIHELVHLLEPATTSGSSLLWTPLCPNGDVIRQNSIDYQLILKIDIT
jgi:predicted metal-dependent hydrolase